MLSEGGRVSYTGGGDGRLSTGDNGRLLSISGDGGHVLFSTGAVAGTVEYLPLHLLSSMERSARSLLADTLDAPEQLSSTAVRETVVAAGEQGLVAALSEAGVLDELAGIGEEAADFVASRIRSDPAMGPIMAALDTEERDQVVALTASMILVGAAHYSEDGPDA
jgi:hypothetical protein